MEEEKKNKEGILSFVRDKDDPFKKKRIIINVYIIQLESSNSNSSELSKSFLHKNFSVNILNIEEPASMPKYGDCNKIDSKLTHMYISSLIRAENDDPDGYSLLLLDNSISNLRSLDIYNIIESLIKNIDVDIYYLSNWLDKFDPDEEFYKLKNCNKTNDDLNTVVYRTRFPNGLQTILFSPHGRKVIIGKENMLDDKNFLPIKCSLSVQIRNNIKQNNLTSAAIHQHIFSCRLDSMKSRTDSLKLTSFSMFGPKEEEDAEPLPWFLYIIFIILIIIFATIGMYLRRR